MIIIRSICCKVNLYKLTLLYQLSATSVDVHILLSSESELQILKEKNYINK